MRQDLTCTTTAPIRCFTNPVTTGTQVYQVPKNSAFVWTSYKFDRWVPGLSAAGGFTYQDELHVRYTTVGTIPNVTLTRDAVVPSTFR